MKLPVRIMDKNIDPEKYVLVYSLPNAHYGIIESEDNYYPEDYEMIGWATLILHAHSSNAKWSKPNNSTSGVKHLDEIMNGIISKISSPLIEEEYITPPVNITSRGTMSLIEADDRRKRKERWIR